MASPPVAASGGGAHVLPTPPRRVLVRFGLHTALSVAAMVVLYLVLPVDRLGASGIVELVGGILGVAVVVTLQLRSIVRADFPGLRAAQVVATTIPLFVFVFAFVYLSLAHHGHDAFTERMDRLSAIYFTVTTLTTTGFGDITARSDTARAVVTVQMLLDLVLIGVVARLVLRAAQQGIARRRSESASS